MSKIFVIWKYDIKVFPSLHNSYFESGMLWIRDDGLWKCNLSMSPPPFYMKIKHSIWIRENIKLRHSEWKCFDMKTWMKIQVIANHLTLTQRSASLSWTEKKNWLANQSHITEISFMPPFLKSLILMESSLSLINEDRFEGSLTPFLYFRTRARVNPQLSWESRCWSRPSHQFRTIIIITMFLIVSRSWSSLLFLNPRF